MGIESSGEGVNSRSESTPVIAFLTPDERTRLLNTYGPESEITAPGGSELPKEPGWTALDRLAVRGITEITWKAVAVFAATISTGGYIAVEIAHHVVDVVAATNGVNNGDGFAYKVRLLEVPGIEIGVNLTVRLCGNGRPGSDLRLGLDVSAFDPLLLGSVEIDKADAAEQIAEFPDVDWPGEWMREYGMAAIRNHRLVLECVGTWHAPRRAG